MSAKNPQTRAEALDEFYSAPNTALFNQNTIALVRDVSRFTMERDRWSGNGIPFVKIGRAVRYRKSDVLTWLDGHQTQASTSAIAA